MQDEKALQLFSKILEKTRSKALKWEAAAEEGQYIAAIGSNLVLKVWPYTEFSDEIGRPVGPPSVSLNDEKGTIVLDMTHKIDGIEAEDLRELATLAKRIALNIDLKLEAAIESLDKLVSDEDIPF